MKSGKQSGKQNKHKRLCHHSPTNNSVQFTQGDPIMLHNNEFAIEQLENRLETLCIYIPYVGVCSRKVWFVTIYYPCTKYYRICF
jgi:hypothetical protein